MKFRTLLIALLSIIVLVVVAACAPAATEPTAVPAVQQPAEPAPTAEPAAQPEPTAVPPAQPEPTAEPAAEPEPTAEPVAEPPALGSSLVGEYQGPVTITDPSQFPASFSEAPMLAEMVAAGDLPPVEDRLPVQEDLLVLQPLDSIGKYGGTWRRGFTGPGDWANGLRVASSDRFMSWDPVAFPDQVPNLAKDVLVSDDGTTYTILMREGVKWSDGAPFTADDVMFWWNDLYGNEELNPVPNPLASMDGVEMTVTKIDDYSFEVKFPKPNYLFKEVLGSSDSLFGGQYHFGQFAQGGYAPAHYLQQFHADFVDQATLDALVAAEGFDSWVTLLKAKNHVANNPELPVLSPWVTESPVSSDTFVLVRNPYYYGVDTAGNQLPYIDRISMTLAENLEVLNLRAIAGEYDQQERHLALGNIPVFLENQEQGNYTLHLDPAQHGTDAGFHFNLSYRDDPEIAKWFNTADFRRALSLGIDRDQINEIFFLGLGVPGSAVVAESGVHNPGPEYRQLWATFDPDMANQMLDDIGLTEKDAEGYRLRTDNGERLVIEVNTIPAFLPFTSIAEMVKEQWADIGIFVNVVEQERSLWAGRLTNNETQISVWQNDGSDELFLFPHHAVPVSTQAEMGPGYGLWYSTNGEQGVEPTDPFVLEVMDLFRSAPGLPDDERAAAGKRIWEIATDQVWTIGTVGQSGAFLGVRVVKNNMGNIPSRQFNIQAGLTPLISRPQTMYFTDAQ